jgi:hypothetical protein
MIDFKIPGVVMNAIPHGVIGEHAYAGSMLQTPSLTSAQGVS